MTFSNLKFHYNKYTGSLRWAGYLARMGESRGTHRVLVWKPEGRRPLGRPWRRWKDNIKMNLRGRRMERMDWTELAQGRERWRAFMNAVMKPRMP